MLPIKFKNIKDLASAFQPNPSRRRPPSNFQIFPPLRTPQSMQSPGTEIQIKRHGSLFQISLSRPKALNALSWEMLTELEKALESAIASPSTNCILLCTQETPRGVWCAGGDVKALMGGQVQQRQGEGEGVNCLRHNPPPSPAAFFSKEYALIARLAASPKPVIALADGAVIGGGAGLFMNAHYRVVTPEASLQMPECKIGFFTDASGTRFLGQVPFRMGYWMAASGEAVPGAGASMYHLGLATHLLQRKDIAIEALIEASNGRYCLNRTLNSLSAPIEPLSQEQIRDWKAMGNLPLSHFEHPERSKVSQRVSWALIDAAKGKGLEQSLKREFEVGQRFGESREFREGVIAKMVEKRTPMWTQDIDNQVDFMLRGGQELEVLEFGPSYRAVPAAVGAKGLPGPDEIAAVKSRLLNAEAIVKEFGEKPGLEQHVWALLKSGEIDSSL